MNSSLETREKGVNNIVIDENIVDNDNDDDDDD